MPRLVAFKRHWSIGSDDFVFSGSLDVFLRFIWLLVVIIMFAVFSNDLQCNNRTQLITYYVGLIVFLILTVLITGLIVFTSSLGTISDSAPRKHLVVLIYIRLAVAVPEVAWNVLGTVWTFHDSRECNPSVLNIAKATVIVGWVVFFIVCMMVIISYDAFGGKVSRKGRSLTQRRSFKRGSSRPFHKSKHWEKRCRCLFCCATKEEAGNSVFTTLAQLSADYFRGMDLVPTDIAAGLILVRDQQLRQRQETDVRLPKERLDSEPITPASPVSLSCQPEPWMTLENMKHYLQFALGSYGWPFYVTLTNPVFGLCSLCTKCRCCSCSTDGPIVKDNCCQCNTAAFLKTTAMHQDDIIYADFSNGLYEVPFYVVLDRTRKDNPAIVISVRGTLSVQDVITDLTLDRGEIDIAGMDCGLAHQGILKSATFIYDILKRKDILSRAFEHAQGARLVVTGHSLGAGSAALLAILLKPHYPDLICFAYAPPGELVSPSVAQYARQFICSVVLGDDMIPRMGMLMMEELKLEMLKALEKCDIPKYKILADGCWRLCCCGREKSLIKFKTNEDGPHDQDLKQRTSLELSVQESLEYSKRINTVYHPLYPPGHIFHVQKSSEDDGFEWMASWSQPEMFTKIIVSDNMLAHHFPDALSDALDVLIENKLSDKSRDNDNFSEV